MTTPATAPKPSRRVPLPQAGVNALVNLYASLPRMECRGLCQQCCGPIAMTTLERARIVRHVGREAKFTPDLTCTLLTPDGRCAAYAVRPLICRLWGLVPRMACPHGCTPERWLTEAESAAFLRQALAIGGITAFAPPAWEAQP
jgi:hypothetical protein